MKQTYWKFVGLCTGAMLLLSCTACGSKTEKGTVRIVEDKSAVTSSPALQEADSQEVNFQTAEVGKEVEAKGVSATLDKVYLSDHTFTEDEQELGLVFFQLTIHNNTDQDLATSFLSNSFAILADGEGYPGIDIRSNRFVMLQFGEDAESFNDPIPAGESRQGYVGAELPADFSTVTFLYFPAAGLTDQSQCFTFDIAREAMEAAPEPVTTF